MDWQNLLKVAAAVALGVATCTLVALQGHTQNSAGRHLSWEDAVPGVPTWPLVCILGGLTAVAMRWMYKLLFCPLELLRAPEDVGYIAEDGRSKAQAANQVRRRRKTGELPPVYPNGWFRVLDSHLLHRGEVRNASVLGEQVAVFRGHSGEAHVVDAYCPHLGANLAVGGRVLGDCIECPFHGWQFQGSDGKCMRIPYAEKVPEIAKLHRWPSCEVNGLILVWFHCEGKEPEWTVPEQEEITSGKWVYRGRTEHFINAHIQEIPENAADLAHLGHLHTPSITSGVDLRHINSKTWQFLRHDWKVRWEPEPEPNQHCSQMFVRHSLTVFGLHCSLLDVHVVARQVGPGLVFLLFNHAFLGRGLLVHCVTPVEPLLQCVTHTMFYQSNMLPVVPKFILRAESIQFERDVMVWNNKRYVSKPLLVKEDQAIQKHRRWFSQFYSESSPRLKLRRHTLDF
eukprot:XP_003978421.1 PREDICTED: cholesterol desaturase daf-36-like [Takifugu rubripes]